MKIAELLRNLADVIDLERQSSTEVNNNEGDLAPQRFVPPLQLKLETTGLKYCITTRQMAIQLQPPR